MNIWHPQWGRGKTFPQPHLLLCRITTNPPILHIAVLLRGRHQNLLSHSLLDIIARQCVIRHLAPHCQLDIRIRQPMCRVQGKRCCDIMSVCIFLSDNALRVWTEMWCLPLSRSWIIWFQSFAGDSRLPNKWYQSLIMLGGWVRADHVLDLIIWCGNLHLWGECGDSSVNG